MNMDLLESKIEASGYKREYIASQIGISRFGLLSKMQNPDRWKVTEMSAIIKLLKLSKTETREIFDL